MFVNCHQNIIANRNKAYWVSLGKKESPDKIIISIYIYQRSFVSHRSIAAVDFPAFILNKAPGIDGNPAIRIVFFNTGEGCITQRSTPGFLLFRVIIERLPSV